MRTASGVEIRSDGMSCLIARRVLLSVEPVKYEDVLPLAATGEERSKAIAEYFSRWKKEDGVSDTVIGLPLRLFSHQVVEMPAMKRADMRNALLFELEKYLPLPVDEYSFDFMMFPPSEGISRVIVFSIKKELSSGIFRTVRDAGCSVLSIRCSFLSALRGLVDVSGLKEINGVFVNMTSDACEIAGLKNSLPVHMKSLPKEADIAAEIQRLLLLYPGTVFISGIPVPGLAEKFNARRVHIQTARPLALSAFRETRFDLDFIESSEAPTELNYYPHAIAGLIAAAVVIYFLSGVMVYYKDLKALKAVEARRTELKSRAAGLLETKKKNEQLAAERNTILDFQVRSNVSIRALSVLSRVIPPGSWLIGISADDRGKIEVEGFTSRTSALVMALEKSGEFSNVSYAAPIIAKDGEERFSLKMEVRGLDK